MSRWLRQHRYACLVALRRLWSQPFSSLSNILVISLSLAIPIIAASVLVSAQPVVRQIPVSPEVTLFLAPGSAPEKATQLAKTVQEDYRSDVLRVRIVARDQAMKTLKANPAWADALSVLSTNPLPDAVVVTLPESPELSRQASSLAQEWRQLENVDSVQLDSEWVRRLEAILGFVRIGLWLLAVGVALVVLATVFNTVRMQALTQREEIGVARLVGATESFVRRPFLYLGALTGIIASLVAIAFSALALNPLNAALARLANSYGTQVVLHLPESLSLLLAVVVVAILAALSARWSVTRNTRF
ncbi:ABC transporter permease [Candidimonas sp. SYP-B2681]|uniref:cell division protein FtsX n=1 Tax=Candidimonas sp. SYP-B2681 TaxID=2497686 RepID=UPI000F87267C|nr:ABC transporter permease [Candidimonas sp. SYP-B2681]RTZ45786.1 ABC transporter permease [Candidimonas sp. SYP-B2681]